MPSMLPYIGIYLFCGLGIAIIIGHEFRSRDEEQQVFEEVCCEHKREALEQCDAFLDAVCDIAADELEPEVGSVEWLQSVHALEAREPVR
jgi:hypothetical protein